MTRSQFLGKLRKPIYKEVEVDGFGTIGLKQRTRLQESRRTYAMFGDNGKVDQGKAALYDFYRIIDQVMVDENTPMFSDADIDLLANSAEGELDGIFAALAEFNSEVDDDPKKSEESSESSESLNATTI